MSLLDRIEKLGNRLPDPAIIFVWLLLATWIASAALAEVPFAELDPRTGQSVRIINQLTGTAFTGFLSRMVRTFMRDVSAEGHVGEPAPATVEIGEALLDHFTAGTVTFLRRVIEWDGRSWRG